MSLSMGDDRLAPRHAKGARPDHSGGPPSSLPRESFAWPQRTLYRSGGVGVNTLFALYVVGFACERTYHWPADVNLNVVRASPALSMKTSRFVTNRQAPELNR